MKSVVLFSSGLDSTYNLYCAREHSQILLALTFDYGQRAADREAAMAAKQSKYLGVPHQILKLEFFKDFTQTSLVNHKAEVPTARQVEINDLRTSELTSKSVWVPNRNGILLNIAAGFAEGLGADWLVPGFNREEAATFPDNTPEFLSALDRSFDFSTQGRVKTKCFSTQLDKTEIVKKALDMKVQFEWVWPCYFGNEKPCGECESCQRDFRALRNNGVEVSWL